ncbi:TPA: AAA family ATPase [Burkholderia cepacia]|uniref:AAA family ATPase n=1 Tax=Burkholderia TaxID=32008 RepID=UPI001588F416|nr:AAA family ATPase [Burkholderia cepacia]MCA8131362.1 AAA family ATPase [Burkholderia cepacia]MCA8159121.1 AAA family ATPase [Burkholderia cepacia]HEM7889480.1 AAA family ATPase [Burkholderia cepacia]HEM8509917.1 AAA family ATPase [Burkholderia cepacia]
MLKRIKEISGVGPYISCKAAAVELKKLTLIYGSNSYGKSTLCDVLRTLETPDTTPIKERKTIPASAAQKVLLSVSEDGQPEVSLRFQDDSWTDPVPYAMKFSVFDSGFISRNLFTGQDIERRNKEALTQFVLGEQGVIHAEQIAAESKAQAQKKSELKILEKGFNGIPNIQAFINTKVSESEVAVEAAIAQLNVSIDRKQKQIANAHKIVTRPELVDCRFAIGAGDAINQLNESLKLSLQAVDEEAKRKLELHISTHMQQRSDAQQWIRQGLEFTGGNECPFCSQPLGEQANELIDVYRKSFNETFKTKFAELSTNMKSAFDRFQKYSGVTYEAKIQANLNTIQLYPELADSDSFKPLPSALEKAAVDLTKSADAFNQLWDDIQPKMAQLIETKRKIPHDEIEGLDSTPLLLSEEAIGNAVAEYNEITQKINDEITAFKRSIEIDKLNQEINSHNVELGTFGLKKRRIQMDATCEEYKALSEKISDLDLKIKKDQQELSQQQSAFLAKFFEKINHYFVKFGSRDFTISTDTALDAKGHQPVISLIVKFKGKKIPTSQLVRVFSESDRRALALSIFWARLSIMTDEEKNKTILIFDDPVTSFDDNRISVTMMEIQSALDKFCQAIFLTHYPKLARHMLVDMRLTGSMAVLKLTKDANGTGLCTGTEEDFIETEHHRKYKKLRSFIDGARDREIDSDLRVFLETEVHERYRQQIFDNGLNKCQLGELITGLESAEALTEEQAKRLHQFREALNGPHHAWSSRSPDDWASLAQEMLSFIYCDL